MLERRAEHQRLTDAGRWGGRRSSGPNDWRRWGRVNVTDPDSRPVKTPRGFIQGYNAQLVAAEGQIIVAAEVTTGSADQGQPAPMVRTARRELDAAGRERPDTVLADAGYWRNRDIQHLV